MSDTLAEMPGFTMKNGADFQNVVANNGATADKEYRFKDSRDKWRKVRVWFIPEIKRGEVELPEVSFNNDEIPF